MTKLCTSSRYLLQRNERKKQRQQWQRRSDKRVAAEQLEQQQDADATVQVCIFLSYLLVSIFTNANPEATYLFSFHFLVRVLDVRRSQSPRRTRLPSSCT